VATPNRNGNPGFRGIGRRNLTEPDPSTSYIPPDASPAPPTTPSDVYYTSSCDPTCAGDLATASTSILTSSSTSSSGTRVSEVSLALPTIPSSSLGAKNTSASFVQSVIRPSDGKGGGPTITSSITGSSSTIGASKGSASRLLAVTSSGHFSIPSSSLSSISANSSIGQSNPTTSIPNKTGGSSIPTRLPYDNSTATANLPTSSDNLELTATIGPSQSGINYANCSTLAPDQPFTVWSIVPNTTTITLTVTGNYSTTYSTSSEFTPPVYCPETTITNAFIDHTPSAITNKIPHKASSTVTASAIPRTTTTAIITAKNPPVLVTTDLYPSYPNGQTDKESPTTSDTYNQEPSIVPGFPSTITAIPTTQVVNEDTSASGPITGVLSDGVTVVVSSNNAVIGGQTFGIGDSTQTITKGGDVFTIGPSQVIGPMLVVNVPTGTAGGVFAQNPTPTTVDGVGITIGPGEVVIDSTSYSIGAGAPDQTIVVQGQTISLGAGGVGFSATTLAPPISSPSNFVIVGGEVFSAIGSSIAVIEGTTLTYGPGVPTTTEVVNGDTITIGPSGVSFDGTTLGGPGNPTGTQLGIVGGLSVTEVGSSLAVVDGVTLTIGPGATPTTAVINGHTVAAGSSGVSIGGATLTFPFNPTTQAVTAGGITFSEVGSSLVVIGGTTFTFGPGAKPTTDIYNGQTISIGPSGVGFKTTTFTAATAMHSGKTNGAGGLLRPVFGVLGACITIGVGCLL